MSGSVEFRLANIALVDCEAIVNPCNRGFLLGFAGVNGAIADMAGHQYELEANRLRETARGEVAVTGAGELPARIVIHAVSPTWNNGNQREHDQLRHLHERVFETAAQHGCSSLALPAIGAGAHRFPPEVAASIAVPTIEELLEDSQQVQRVVFALRDRWILSHYLAHSSTTDAAGPLVAALRQEISDHLRDARRPDLAQLINDLDAADLRTIQREVAELHHASGADSYDHSASVGTSTLYLRAVEQLLAPDRRATPEEKDTSGERPAVE